MPEYPDLTLYCESIEQRFAGQALSRVRVASPFLLRSYDPPISAVAGKTLHKMSRLGKRLVFHLDDELYLVLHLMIAGRLREKPAGAPIPGKVGLAAFDFASSNLRSRAQGRASTLGPDTTLILTEASPKKRASLYVVQGAQALAALDPGGLEPFEISLAQFAGQLRAENHTLKRSLTDPHLFAAIGNAYSDEILHRAKLSPVQLTSRIKDADIARLLEATRQVLSEWTDLLRKEGRGNFPDKVTAFHKQMAAHGKFGKPCPVCGELIQRIVRASNEANYCPRCQTGGKLLADRSLSRLLHDDWPATPEELEEQKRAHRENLNKGL